jgi:hypothetical protein
VATLLFITDLHAAHQDEVTFDHGYRVVGVVAPGWDGGRDVTVLYRHPSTGLRVRAATHVWDGSRLPDTARPVLLEVSRTDPLDVVVAGDRFPATSNLANYAPWVVLPFLVWMLRRRRLRRSEALVSSSDTAYRMTATVSPPRWWGRRWRLHLFALDAGPPGTPVCTLPLIDAPDHTGTFAVEVKGKPQPYGSVVARQPESGEVYWPAGRALHSHGRLATRSALPPTTAARRAARWFGAVGLVTLVAGGIAMGVGPDAEDVRARSHLIGATVISTHARSDGRSDLTVTYRWADRPYEGTFIEADPPAEGTRIAVRVDGWTPTRVWSTTTETPPETDEHDLGGGLIGCSLVLLGIAVFGVVRSRRFRTGAHAPTWKGFRIHDGRLWYGTPSRYARRPAARFEPDGVVFVAHDGSEWLLRWPDHSAAGAPLSPSTWGLHGVRPYRGSFGQVRLDGPVAGGGAHRSLRLADRGWGDVLWQEVPALAAYLAATPLAREALVDPERMSMLLGELGSGRWRHPHPPRKPLFGDPLQLDITIELVLGRRSRWFGRRPVRYELMPHPELLVDEVISVLPAHVRDTFSRHAVAVRVHRYLVTGAWPFDVLLPRMAPAVPAV